MMIFVPLSSAQLAALVASGELRAEVAGFTATTALRRDAEIGPSDDEEADFVAFGYAAAAAVALTSTVDPGRTVIAVESEPGAATIRDDDPQGHAVVTSVRWPAVTAVYLDEPAAAAAVAQSRDATAGLAPDDAYDHPSMQTLLDAHDLLWHLPSEVAH